MIGYKYRAGGDMLKRDVNALQNDYYWASPIADLNDPCEAFVEHEAFKPPLEQFIKVMGIDNDLKVQSAWKEVYSQLDEIVNKCSDVGIFSLSRIPNNQLLWAHYAHSHQGFCIGYETDILIKSKPYGLNFLDVVYSQEVPKITEIDIVNLVQTGDIYLLIKKMIGTKSQEWSYEQEIRIIADIKGKQEHDFRAVKSIHFGLKMSDSDKEFIMQQLAGRGIEYYQIYQQGKTYSYEAIPVIDKFKHTPRYLYKIAPIDKDAIDENSVKDYLMPYIPYLYKAAEVAKREPYCSQVNDVAFSLYDSKPDKPIIYTNYENLSGEVHQYRYTIQEIEKEYSLIKDI